MSKYVTNDKFKNLSDLGLKETGKDLPESKSADESYSIADALDRDYAKNGGKPAPVPSGRK